MLLADQPHEQLGLGDATWFRRCSLANNYRQGKDRCPDKHVPRVRAESCIDNGELPALLRGSPFFHFHRALPLLLRMELNSLGSHQLFKLGIRALESLGRLSQDANSQTVKFLAVGRLVRYSIQDIGRGPGDF